MNSREQFLLKRVRELEARPLVVMQELQRVAIDRDYTESVGCAFAWDVAQMSLDTSTDHFAPYLPEALEARWDDAVKATEAMLDEAQGIRRAADGSIISILPKKASEK